MVSRQPDTQIKAEGWAGNVSLGSVSIQMGPYSGCLLLSGELPQGLVTEHSLPLLCVVWTSWDVGQGSEGMTSLCPTVSEVSVGRLSGWKLELSVDIG